MTHEALVLSALDLFDKEPTRSLYEGAGGWHLTSQVSYQSGLSDAEYREVVRLLLYNRQIQVSESLRKGMTILIRRAKKSGSNRKTYTARSGKQLWYDE